MENFNVFVNIDKKDLSMNYDKLNEVLKDAKRIANNWYAFENDKITISTNKFNELLYDATYEGDFVVWLLRDGEQCAGKRYEVQEVRGEFK